MLARPRRWLRFIVLLMVSQPTIAVHGQDPALALEETVVKLVERIEPSVVSIARVKPAPSDSVYVQLAPPERLRREQELPPTDPEDPDFQPNDFGAGIIITPPGNDERLVLTNYHVVRGGPVFPSTSTGDGTSRGWSLLRRRSTHAPTGTSAAASGWARARHGGWRAAARGRGRGASPAQGGRIAP